MRPLPLLVIVLALVAGALVRGATRDDTAADRAIDAGASRRLDSRRVDYYEAHEDARIVAEIAVLLESREDGGAELVVRPSALGPFVDPPPGPRARRGANETTAREMASAFQEGRLAFVTRSATGETISGAGAVDGMRGTIDVRRHGRVPGRDFGIDDAPSRRNEAALLPLELELATGPLPCGRWTSEVLLDARSRLAVDFEVTPEGGAILAVRGAGPPRHVETEP